MSLKDFGIFMHAQEHERKEENVFKSMLTMECDRKPGKPKQVTTDATIKLMSGDEETKPSLGQCPVTKHTLLTYHSGPISTTQT